MRARSAALFLLWLPGLALAQSPDKPAPWSGEASAGVVATSGNSETQSSNARIQVVYTSELWRNTLEGSALQASSTQTNELTGAEESKVTTERYTLGDKADFNFTERDYAFLALEFEKDLIGPIRERTSETAGYGRKILTGPDHLLEAEVGAGMRQTETQVTPTAPIAVKEDDAIGRGRLGYRWNFREDSYLGETFKVESGKSNTTMESVTEAKLSLVGKLFALASYTVRQNTDVPPGTEKTDTVTAFSLGWTFGKS